MCARLCRQHQQTAPTTEPILGPRYYRQESYSRFAEVWKGGSTRAIKAVEAIQLEEKHKKAD